MRIHNPIFPHDTALFIIWAHPPKGEPYTLAAGGLRAMNAAWPTVQDEARDCELTLQHGARVIRSRDPMGR
ncbi:hypothetical protein [Paracoccus homiensis]|uniref:Uncharacterized protein n=1 Tax=Paracoccus homiensis TaxID=364199 RepID=A0A1I0J3S5_9RHOB|nr:hypothetical protein [Paracoccus homiensis]SEU03649.1 hypothetical protein SAMN04489858_12083 [Paracoccus homiensis]